MTIHRAYLSCTAVVRLTVTRGNGVQLCLLVYNLAQFLVLVADSENEERSMYSRAYN